MATFNVTNTKKGDEISKEFFKNYATCPEVSKKVYKIKSKSKTKTIGTVKRYCNQCKEKEYWECARVRRGKGTITAYRLNLRPFFEYANEKIKFVREKEEKKYLKKLKKAKDKNLKNNLKSLLKFVKEKEFNKEEEKFLEYLFDLKGVREISCQRETLIDGILSVIEKIFFYGQISGERMYVEIAKAFFSRDKRYFKKYDNLEEQYKEFRRVTNSFLNELYNKICCIIDTEPVEWSNLNENTEFDIYSYIPSAIYKREGEENKKRLLRRFEIAFHERRKPTREEIFNLKMED